MPSIHTARRVLGVLALLSLTLMAAPSGSAADQPVPGPPSAYHPADGSYTAVPANVPPPIEYQAPAISSLASIWLGALTVDANIRTGPGLAYAVNRVWRQGRRVLVFATATATNRNKWYQVQHYPDPVLYVSASLVTRVADLELPATQRDGRWIDVNLNQQTVLAYKGGQPVLLAQASTGQVGHETPVGTWRIYWRLRNQDMDSRGTADGSGYYNLADVPYVQYFQTEGDALHGTYWHDNFGTPMSHGCVNLSYQNAEWLYHWAGLGTVVRVHP